MLGNSWQAIIADALICTSLVRFHEIRLSGHKSITSVTHIRLCELALAEMLVRLNVKDLIRKTIHALPTHRKN